MKSYIIEYDLRQPGRNYDALYDAIKSFGAWAHITESTWFIKSGSQCTIIRDKLMECLDKNDRIFVAELTGVAAWYNTICEGEFLKENL